MRRLKRIVCLFLSIFLLATVQIDGYVQAAWALPFSVSSWEIMQTIMLSLGVSVTVQESSLTDEICRELVDTYNLWAKSNGFDDAAQLKQDLKEMLVAGSSAVVSIGENCWNALRSWAGSLARGETDISGARIGFNCLKSLYYEQEISFYGDGVCLLRGMTSYDVSVPFYGVVGYAFKKGEGPYNAVVFSNKPFSVSGSLIQNYSWKKIPSDYHDVPYQNSERSFSLSSVSYSTSVGKIYYCDIGVECHLNKCSQFTAPFVVSGGTVKSAPMETIKILVNDYHILDGINGVTWDVVGGSAVADEAWDIITPGRTWDGERVAGDVSLNIPADVALDIPAVASGEKSVTNVLDNAIPVDVTADRAVEVPYTIDEAIDAVNERARDRSKENEKEKEGDVISPGIETDSEYTVKGLENVFPFCIPFDIFSFLNALTATPQAPYFVFPIPYVDEKGMQTFDLVIDLSSFDDVAFIVRKCELLLFCVGLAVSTRSIYLRG